MPGKSVVPRWPDRHRLSERLGLASGDGGACSQDGPGPVVTEHRTSVELTGVNAAGLLHRSKADGINWTRARPPYFLDVGRPVVEVLALDGPSPVPGPAGARRRRRGVRRGSWRRCDRLHSDGFSPEPFSTMRQSVISVTPRPARRWPSSNGRAAGHAPGRCRRGRRPKPSSDRQHLARVGAGAQSFRCVVTNALSVTLTRTAHLLLGGDTGIGLQRFADVGGELRERVGHRSSLHLAEGPCRQGAYSRPG